MFKTLVCPCATVVCLVEGVTALPLKVQESRTERGEFVIQRREREVLKRTAILAGTMETVGGACVCVFVKDTERDIVELSDCTALVRFAVPHSGCPPNCSPVSFPDPIQYPSILEAMCAGIGFGSGTEANHGPVLRFTSDERK